jgi:ribonuclease P protein component
MLPRPKRLTTTEFAKAFENGRVLRHPLLQLRVHLRGDGESVARAAFVAPKKLGKATQRNRIRRRIRERFRLLQSEYSNRPLSSCDMIFIVGAAAEKASGPEVDGALLELLRRAAKFIEKSGAGDATHGSGAA